MKKKIFTLFAGLLMTFTGLMAQDAIHGVDGYYNWTSKQMKADNVFYMNTSGYVGTSAIAKAASLTYNDDYIRVNMGLKTDPNKYRTDWKMRFDGVKTLKITKEYPVLALKIGLPSTAVAKDFNQTIELAWKFKIKQGDTVQSRTSGTLQNSFQVNNNPAGVSFLGSNFRYFKNSLGTGSWNSTGSGRFQWVGWWKAIDNVYQYTLNSKAAIGDSVPPISGASTLQGIFKVDDPIAGMIEYINFKQVVDSVGDIEIYTISGIMDNYVADSTKTVIERNEAGDSIGTKVVAKTRDELPFYNIKWFKTFSSLQALKEQVAVNAGDGNDTRSDNQLILNSALYYAKKSLQNYAYSDPLYFNAYQTAFDKALATYNTVAPNEDKTSAEWLTWDATIASAITELAAAKEAFLKGITAKFKTPYNIIKTVNGEAEFALGANVTMSTGVKGQLLALKGQGSGFPFLMNKSSVLVNGRKSYTLSDAKSTGKVCLVKDTLIFVENANLASASQALFVFSNRSDNEYPAYDMLVNNKYLYLKSDGSMGTVAEIPDGEVGDLGAYLFDLSEAIYDPSGDGPVADLFQGFEFNDGSLNNWEKNNWRMYSQISNKNYDNNGSMQLSIAENYYTATDTTFTTLLNSDFVNGMEGGYRRESGKYANIAKLNPTVRDSALIIWTNPFVKRFLAIKTAGSRPDINITKFTLFSNAEINFTPDDTIGRKGDVYYWDMLLQGVPYGNKGYNSQYFSAGKFFSKDEVLLVDWIRTYASIEEIPNEILDVKAGLFTTLSNNNNVRILTNENLITVEAEKASEITIYSVNGVKLYSDFTNKTSFSASNKGVYIIAVRDENARIVEKVMVK